jgi:hypothetical protein
MKEYPLTDSDIETLGLTKGGATFFFSGGSLLVGFILHRIDTASWDMFKASVALPLTAGAVGAAIVCFFVGSYLWWQNGSAVRRIKNEVKFD